MVFCVIPNCGAYSKRAKEIHKHANQGLSNGENFDCDILSFFTIPKKEDLRKKWLEAVFSEKAENQECKVFEKKGACVCSKHFDSSDFSISSTKRQRLLPYAIPHVNLLLSPLKKRVKSYGCENYGTSTPNNDANYQAMTLPLSPIQNVQIRKRLFERSNQTNECHINLNQNDYTEELVTKSATSTQSPNEVKVLFENVSPELSLKESSTQTLSETVSTDVFVVTKEASTQASPIIRKRNINYKVKNLKRTQGKLICRLRKKVVNLESKVSKMSDNLIEFRKIKNEQLNKQLALIKEGSQSNDLAALFLIEQILSFKKKTKMYSDYTLRVSSLLFKKSPCAYNFLRDMKILHLPHRITLRRYIGHASGEHGVTSLVKERLKVEYEKLTDDRERYGSLVFDEMAIRSKLLYDRNMDTFFGETTLSAANGVGDTLASHLLCFIFHGLSTSIRIPVAYFFTANLTSDQLYSIILQVIEAVESCGFIVLRLVADNAKINTATFRKLGEGTIQHVVTHPLDTSRPLFIAFDQSHLIKNIRNQFLSREMLYIGLVISSKYLKKLYDLQKGNLLKPVRFLTRKHLFPTSFEKMNVLRAVQIFSVEVIAALKSIIALNMCDSQDIDHLLATIYFMEMIHKWHDIHDISNQTLAIHSRNENKLPFYDVEDERLTWLLEDFQPFIELIQTNATNKFDCFTCETYEALQITTKSTVECAKYLLDDLGFHFVLTRKFSSDIVEATFSNTRRSGGYNDLGDVRSCILSLEHTLKIGIIKASSNSNVSVGKKSDCEGLQIVTSAGSDKRVLRSEVDPKKKIRTQNVVDLPGYLKRILNRMECLTGKETSQISIRSCTLAHVGGYLVKIAEENSTCEDCLGKLVLSEHEMKLKIHTLIEAQDRGGLKYPSDFFVCLIGLVLDFVQMSLNLVPRQQTLTTYMGIILPYFSKPLKCKCDNPKLPKVILEKFLRPLLHNHAKEVTDQKQKIKKTKGKPLSRKVLRV